MSSSSSDIDEEDQPSHMNTSPPQFSIDGSVVSQDVLDPTIL